VTGLGDVPSREPSKPLSFPERKAGEIREVDVPGTNVTVRYEHHHETGLLTLLLVATEGS
jgi:hypothetical protein